LADALCADVDRRDGLDDVAILLMRRRTGSTPAAGGRLRQHVAPEDPEALSGARHLIRPPPAPGARANAPTRSNWPPTR
ncbi:hypothetical protein SF12_14745, partial [Streptomyces sp. MBRL 601]